METTNIDNPKYIVVGEGEVKIYLPKFVDRARIGILSASKVPLAEACS